MTASSSRSRRSPKPLPNVDAERLVLALDPRAADAEDRAAVGDVVEGRGELRGEAGVAEGVRGRPSGRAGSGWSPRPTPRATSQPSKIGWRHGPTIASRWSHVQTLSQPAASAATAASRNDAPVGALRPELDAEPELVPVAHHCGRWYAPGEGDSGSVMTGRDGRQRRSGVDGGQSCVDRPRQRCEFPSCIAGSDA